MMTDGDDSPSEEHVEMVIEGEVDGDDVSTYSESAQPKKNENVMRMLCPLLVGNAQMRDNSDDSLQRGSSRRNGDGGDDLAIARRTDDMEAKPSPPKPLVTFAPLSFQCEEHVEMMMMMMEDDGDDGNDGEDSPSYSGPASPKTSSKLRATLSPLFGNNFRKRKESHGTSIEESVDAYHAGSEAERYYPAIVACVPSSSQCGEQVEVLMKHDVDGDDSSMHTESMPPMESNKFRRAFSPLLSGYCWKRKGLYGGRSDRSLPEGNACRNGDDEDDLTVDESIDTCHVSMETKAKPSLSKMVLIRVALMTLLGLLALLGGLWIHPLLRTFLRSGFPSASSAELSASDESRDDAPGENSSSLYYPFDDDYIFDNGTSTRERPGKTWNITSDGQWHTISQATMSQTSSTAATSNITGDEESEHSPSPTTSSDRPEAINVANSNATDDKDNAAPTSPPTTSSTAEATSTTSMAFYAMADAPYSDYERDEILPRAIANLDVAADGGGAAPAFLVHLGDLQRAATDGCERWAYRSASDILKESALPVFVLPGDNDINDCDDLEHGMHMWEKYFAKLDERWDHEFEVTRWGDLDESFSFLHNAVLFFGLNIVGGEPHSRSEWKERHALHLKTVKRIMAERSDEFSVAVLLGHASPGEHHEDFFEGRDGLAAFVEKMGKPFLHLHGDDHRWSEREGAFGAENYAKVCLDTGENAPPVRVEIDVGRSNPIRIDRRVSGWKAECCSNGLSRLDNDDDAGDSYDNDDDGHDGYDDDDDDSYNDNDDCFRDDDDAHDDDDAAWR